MNGSGISGQTDPDSLLSKFGADMSSQWAQAVADEADRLREQMKKDSVKKAEMEPSAMAMIPMGVVIVELQPPTITSNDKGLDTSMAIGSRSVMDTHRTGKDNVGTKGAVDISQNQAVFNQIGEGQLMSIITNVLDKWNEGVEKAGDQKQKAREEGAKIAFNDFVDQVRHQGKTAPHYFDSHVIIATMVMASGLVGYGEGKHRLTDDFKTNFRSLEEGTNVTVKMIPSDMRAELGLLGAMMLASTVPYSAAWSTVTQTEKTEPNQNNIDKAFVKNYAERMIKLTSDVNYTNYLQAIVTLHVEGAQPTQNQIAQWVNMLKIGLLMTSLALFCQLETGDRPGERVASMLGGTKPIDPTDPKASLLNTIKLYLKTLTPEQRVDVLAAIMEYLDSKPDVKTLMNPVSTFVGLRDAGAFAENQRPTQA